MGKTEKIGNLTEDVVEELTKSSDRRQNWFARFLWKNAFPVICGVIVTGAATWVTDMAADYAETKKNFVHFQLETDYKFRRAEDALRTLAAEVVALRTLLEHQQVDVGMLSYKLDWHHPRQRQAHVAGESPPDPEVDPDKPELPEQPRTGLSQEELDRFMEELKKRLGRNVKVSPEDVERILAKGGMYKLDPRQFEQRQMPNLPPAGGR
jgi:hypothetical protein